MTDIKESGSAEEIETDPILSQIVNIIDEHNDNIPEGDYLAIMNRLKQAFQARPRQQAPLPLNHPPSEIESLIRIQNHINDAILNIKHWMLYFNGGPNSKIIEYNIKILEELNLNLNEIAPGFIHHIYVPQRTTDEFLHITLMELSEARNELLNISFYNFITRTKQQEFIDKIYAVGRFIAFYSSGLRFGFY